MATSPGNAAPTRSSPRLKNKTSGSTSKSPANGVSKSPAKRKSPWKKKSPPKRKSPMKRKSPTKASAQRPHDEGVFSVCELLNIDIYIRCLFWGPHKDICFLSFLFVASFLVLFICR